MNIHVLNIINARRRYDGEVTALLSTYRHKLNDIKAAANQYKDANGHINSEQKTLISKTRPRLDAAGKLFMDTVTTELEPLRNDIYKHIAEPVRPEQINNIRVYADFNIKPTIDEIRTMLKATNNNYTALRAVQTVADRYGYRVDVPSTDALERAFKAVSRAMQPPIMLAEQEYFPEARDTFADVPYRTIDGVTAYSTGRPDTITLIREAATHKKAQEALDEINRLWCERITPSVEAFVSVKDEEGNTVTAEQQQADAVEHIIDGIETTAEDSAAYMAKQTAAEQAEANRYASEVLKQYKLPGSR